jgi:hypothetical protein
MTRQDLYEFARIFGIHLDREILMPKLPRSPISDDPISDNISVRVWDEPGYQLTIRESQLVRLISMLKQKGYYHDDDYTKRLHEEELILSHSELKRMHDEYKMMLYMLCGDEYQ